MNEAPQALGVGSGWESRTRIEVDLGRQIGVDMVMRAATRFRVIITVAMS
jgi:hypothetical protein